MKQEMLLETDGIVRELEQILRSNRFSNAPRTSRFLTFLVREKLAGRLDRIKESIIGVEVFGKDPGYDPKLDATVRTEAIKLRSRLRDYYATEGRTDRVVMSVPKGGYVPVFSQAQEEDPQLQVAQNVTNSRGSRQIPPRLGIIIGAALLFGLATFFLARLRPGHDKREPDRLAEATRLKNRGEAFLRLGVPSDVRNGIDYFKLAVSADPGDAQAHALLALAYIKLAEAELDPVDELISLARKQADLALHLNRAAAESHNAIAQVLIVGDYKWDEADREFKNALSIDSSYVDARYEYAHMCLTPRGLYAESARVISDGLNYDPMSGTLNTELASVKLRMGDVPGALDEYHESLARYPDSPGTLTGLAVALLTLGRLDDALQCLLNAQRVNPNDTWSASYLALCYVKLHQLSKADAILERVMMHSPLPNYTVATIYAAMGKPNQAFEHLERAYINHSSKLLWLQVDLRLEPLRNDLRFAHLVDRLHLTKYAKRTKLLTLNPDHSEADTFKLRAYGNQ